MVMHKYQDGVLSFSLLFISHSMK